MSQIIESKKITDLLQYADSKTLVIFDVDNTLIEPEGFVGGVAWFNHVMMRLQKKGLSEQEAGMKIYSLWIQLQHAVSVKAVESETASVVAQLHKKDIKTMGLTARGFDLAHRTVEQLKSVGISIEKNTIYQKEMVLDERSGFVKGVLSIDPIGNKGEKLERFFDAISYYPQGIVFIDDLPGFLESVRGTMDAKNIPFTGIYYRAAEERMQQFDPARADDQVLKMFKGTKYQELVESLL